MTALELLQGRNIKVKTDVGVEVELTIEKVEANHHSVDLAPPTRENDWWPPSNDWTNYTVHFTNGYSKKYDSLTEINVI